MCLCLQIAAQPRSVLGARLVVRLREIRDAEKDVHARQAAGDHLRFPHRLRLKWYIPTLVWKQTQMRVHVPMTIQALPGAIGPLPNVPFVPLRHLKTNTLRWPHARWAEDGRSDRFPCQPLVTLNRLRQTNNSRVHRVVQQSLQQPKFWISTWNKQLIT